jgi:hypothetical protein
LNYYPPSRPYPQTYCLGGVSGWRRANCQIGVPPCTNGPEKTKAPSKLATGIRNCAAKLELGNGEREKGGGSARGEALEWSTSEPSS